MTPTFYARAGKRFFDLAIATPLAIVLLPVMLIVATFVRIVLGPGVVFRQVRPGRHGRLFTLRKLRTMNNARDATGALLPDGARLTRFGKLLRSTSLDEVPQLWHVISGDMSLVGPRPLLVEYLPLYDAEQARRHNVRPGITGWAQVNGRNLLNWHDRFALDVWYVDHVSLRLDLKIIWMTLVNVLRREGVSAEAHVSMPKFTGRPQ